MNDLQKSVQQGGSTAVIVDKYQIALQVLDQYLDLVELPPTSSGHYDQEFDTMVGETARLT
jgi:hypothetical protein